VIQWYDILGVHLKMQVDLALESAEVEIQGQSLPREEVTYQSMTERSSPSPSLFEPLPCMKCAQIL
jgi:hypothetical protein